MLLPTEEAEKEKNGNRNRGRRLTEPSAPLTERERKAARARQPLTARDRARAGSGTRDPEQRRPHSARKGRGRVGREPGRGAAGASEPREPGHSGRPESTRARAGVAPTRSAGGEASGRRGRASERAGVRARRGGARPSASQPSGGGRACAGRGLLPRPRHVHRLLPVPFLRGGRRSCSIPGPRRDPSSSRTAVARGLGLWSTRAKAAQGSKAEGKSAPHALAARWGSIGTPC